MTLQELFDFIVALYPEPQSASIDGDTVKVGHRTDPSVNGKAVASIRLAIFGTISTNETGATVAEITQAIKLGDATLITALTATDLSEGAARDLRTSALLPWMSLRATLESALVDVTHLMLPLRARHKSGVEDSEGEK